MSRRPPPCRAFVLGWTAVWLGVVALAGCATRAGDEDAARDAWTLADAPLLDGGRDAPDAPPDVPVDTPRVCETHDQCQAGVSWCESRRLCAPLDPRADLGGCVALAPLCRPGQECRADTRTCVGCWDEDLDGAGASECGGPDCNDADPAIHPGAPDPCGGGDTDCDGRIDDDARFEWVFEDADGDGQASSYIGAPSRYVCEPLAGWTTVRGDCDDGSSARYSGAPELCDGLDNDCNGLVDGPDEDDDGDGYIDARCASSWDAPDCDDTDPLTYPRAWEEPCSDVDRDCDGHVHRDWDGDSEPSEWCGGLDCNDYDPAVQRPVDADGDGQFSEACWPGRDCDDADPYVYWGSPEICNRLVDDCQWRSRDPDRRYEDLDSDGFAPIGAACRDDVPGAFPRTDCDDRDWLRYPGAAEVCDGLDNDCDSSTPDGSAPGSCPPGTACIDHACV